jgi:hypothetical protein
VAGWELRFKGNELEEDRLAGHVNIHFDRLHYRRGWRRPRSRRRRIFGLLGGDEYQEALCHQAMDREVGVVGVGEHSGDGITGGLNGVN